MEPVRSNDLILESSVVDACRSHLAEPPDFSRTGRHSRRRHNQIVVQHFSAHQISVISSAVTAIACQFIESCLTLLIGVALSGVDRQDLTAGLGLGRRRHDPLFSRATLRSSTTLHHHSGTIDFLTVIGGGRVLEGVELDGGDAQVLELDRLGDRAVRVGGELLLLGAVVFARLHVKVLPVVRRLVDARGGSTAHRR